jgi:hypothetical protein
MKLTRSVATRAAILAVGAVAAAGVAACGDETVDTGQLESDLSGQLSQDAGVDPADVSVDCPDDEPKEEGQKFDCTLTAPNGDEVTVNVTLTDGGDQFEAVGPTQQFK